MVVLAEHFLVRVRHLEKKQQKYKAKGVEGYLVWGVIGESSLEPEFLKQI
jgi:hypothetical protein